jgi:predicted RNA binding protein YcfA (HicA-like mRNA interferase family)
VNRRLEAAGFIEAGQRESHVKFAKSTPQGTLIVIVPHHREVAVGTLRSILRQAGLSQDAFEHF